MRLFKLSLSIVSLTIVLLLINTASGQTALLGVSRTEVIAGDIFYAFYNITTTKDKPIIGFELTVIAPKGWKVERYKASGITIDGKDIKIEWNGSKAFYRGEDASLAQVSFLVWVPPYESGPRTLEASGYILVREGGNVRRYDVFGSKRVNVHPWEPMVFLNLSKTNITPPGILKASVRILTAPPLYPADMRNVFVKVEDSIKGIVYQETREYWPFGTVMEAQFPIEIPQDAPGGKQIVRVTVEYEVFGSKLSTRVDYPYEVIKPSKVIIERVDVPKEIYLDEPLSLRVVVVNPSSFDALDVEVHAKLGEDHQSIKVGKLAPGDYAIENLTLKPTNVGEANLSVWVVWTQEYPRSTLMSEKKSLNVTVKERGSYLTIFAGLIVLVILVAAVKYVLKKRGTREPKE
ncbi:MAG: hypothetical protein LM591_00995 [Candidatus Korarchaeum sp.]|jgi:hypothetical protein|nr:hypothetical protein [Candidatus Korarchaeum sp.]